MYRVVKAAECSGLIIIRGPIELYILDIT